MEVYTTIEKGVMVFKLIGELDEHAAEFVRRKLDKELNDNEYVGVIFDLSRLSFMDSTGIGVIIGRYKIAKKSNKPIYVREPSPTIDKIFKMSGLYEIIQKI